MNELDSMMLTILGINIIFAAYILSSIQNINDFDSLCKLFAYAGLYPNYQTIGKFNAKSTRMSKCGKRLLRYALICSFGNVVLHNAIFKTYYDKKNSISHLLYAVALLFGILCVDFDICEYIE